MYWRGLATEATTKTEHIPHYHTDTKILPRILVPYVCITQHLPAAWHGSKRAAPPASAPWSRKVCVYPLTDSLVVVAYTFAPTSMHHTVFLYVRKYPPYYNCPTNDQCPPVDGCGTCRRREGGGGQFI